jgi:hypothetical protein
MWGIFNIPVNTRQGGILTERSVTLVRLLPDLLALLDIVRRVDGVVDANDHDQGPGQGYENSICIQGASAVSLTSSEGIEGSHGEDIPKVKLGNLKPEQERGYI